MGVVYDINQVEAQQIAADLAITKAIGVVSEVQAFVKTQQTAQAKTQLIFNRAFSQEEAAEKTLQKAQQVFDQAVEVKRRAEANLNTA